MDSVFVDSNVFIGILNAHDALHERSVALWKKLQERQYRVVLSHFIVSEVVTVLSYRSHKQDALYFAQSIYFDNNHEVDIVRLDETLELRALEVMRSASSKNISLRYSGQRTCSLRINNWDLDIKINYRNNRMGVWNKISRWPCQKVVTRIWFFRTDSKAAVSRSRQ